jgi:hypothetical protein
MRSLREIEKCKRIEDREELMGNRKQWPAAQLRLEFIEARASDIRSERLGQAYPILPHARRSPRLDPRITLYKGFKRVGLRQPNRRSSLLSSPRHFPRRSFLLALASLVATGTGRRARNSDLGASSRA